MMRRVLVTPLLISPQPNEQNSSNRVVRQFFEYTDHFIRVTFTDEDHGSILDCSSSVDIMEKRLRKIIHQGLFIGGRHFVFLAFSNSQIREQSCWFFDESARPLSAANLLEWLWVGYRNMQSCGGIRSLGHRKMVYWQWLRMLRVNENWNSKRDKLISRLLTSSWH